MSVDAYHQLVRDVMVRDIVSVGPNETLHDVLDTMLENGLSTLPVVDEEHRCIGVIAAVDLLAPTHALEVDLHQLAADSTEDRADFVETFQRHGLSGHRVEDFMSSRVVSAPAHLPLPQAAATMLQNQVHHLMVVDAHDNLVGILSTMDILDAFSRPVRDSVT